MAIYICSYILSSSASFSVCPDLISLYWSTYTAIEAYEGKREIGRGHGSTKKTEEDGEREKGRR